MGTRMEANRKTKDMDRTDQDTSLRERSILSHKNGGHSRLGGGAENTAYLSERQKIIEKQMKKVPGLVFEKCCG